MASTRLTKLELQNMEILWTHGPAAVREVQERFPEKSRPAYTTVQTMMYRLETKKVARRRPSGAVRYGPWFAGSAKFLTCAWRRS